MGSLKSIAIVSDIHYAAAAEQQRGWPEGKIIRNPWLRLAVRMYRHFIWQRDPFAHNHLLDRFAQEVNGVDYVFANGDYSCDTGFVGVSDDAAFESATECIRRLRQGFGSAAHLTLGDHELGKMSLFGGCGGMRLASWHRAQHGLELKPFWAVEIGRYLVLGITSSLVGYPVYEPETLSHEREEWTQLRKEHLACIRAAFAALQPSQKVLLFCHDPTALPFLWHDDFVRSKADQIENTIIGHLHSPLYLWKSRWLAGMPTVHFLGNSIRRMSAALNQARHWTPFKLRLCPALAGIELLKDGGYCLVELDLDARQPPKFQFRPLPRTRSG